MDERVVVIDPQMSGVSGDMFVGALVDLGADATRVTDAMRTPMACLSGCEELQVQVQKTTRKGLQATRVDVKATDSVSTRPAIELKRAIEQCARRLDVSAKASGFALRAIDTLTSCEARVHGRSTDDVHLHESASADTVADVVGSAVALDDLGLLNAGGFYCTPIAVGGGPFQFSHGMISSPAPAALEILRSAGLLIAGGPIEAELATPTGAALVAALSPQPVTFYPPMKPTDVGYGAAARDFAEMPNLLRIVLGEPCAFGLAHEKMFVVETNLDDTSGEVIAHAADRLLREGARDVSAVPILTKKGRPGHTLRVIADPGSVERMSRLLIEETGSLGVRLYQCERRTLARESLVVDIAAGDDAESVTVKVARAADGAIVQIKPEYDDVKRIADSLGKPMREVQRLAIKRAEEVLGDP